MSHPAFEHLRTQAIPTLRLSVESYRHKQTAARHFHMAAEDRHNAFLVAFLTAPQDSTGIAHILEHTSLCGSERYPVRDPFFMMIRRSLNTFMNAFTANDWTAYPFASMNKKDFNNLLQVYIDSVFFPLLDPLDFAQEGHRVEFENEGDATSPLVYKGVVFNEMKGAMSSPIQRVWQTLQSQLFPSVTYHHNSGGEPAAIPDLSHDQLVRFHARHYHPSNAVFMTYGDIAAAEHHEAFETLALRRFTAKPLNLAVPPERRLSAPLRVSDTYALDGEQSLSGKTHVVMGWLLGEMTDLMQLMEAHLLAGVLLDHSASPVRQALETTDLGSAPSALCGVDDATREMTLVVGLEGAEPAQADQIEALILTVLTAVAEQGVPHEQSEAVLHQLELSQREIGGGHFPYGLQLMVNALGPAIHGGDPVAVLNLDPVLAQLRERIADPGYIKRLTRELLLNNPHRVRLVCAPDATLSAKQAAAETRRLAALKDTLSDADKQRIIDLAAALKQRQAATEDCALLPKVTLDDVGRELAIPEGRRCVIADMPATWFAQGTNGLAYQQIVVDLPALEPELLDVLPYFCDAVNEVGVGDRDYLAVQHRQAAVTGGIGARLSIRGALGDPQTLKGAFVLSGKALLRNHRLLNEMLRETLFKARFDELPRLRELVAQARAHRESTITDRGHSLAMLAAAAGFAPGAALSHRWSGLAGVRSIKALDAALDDAAELAAFAEKLKAIQDRIIAAPRQVVLVGEQAQREAIVGALSDGWCGQARNADTAHFAAAAVARRVHQAWSTASQVSFCAKAYRTAGAGHPDAAALTVLAPFLRNGFLHRAIRERGGAYGGGATWDGDAGVFNFYSYRDPRLAETLADFDAAIDWLLKTSHDDAALEEAILGVIGGIDRPDSPAGEAIGAFFAAYHGRTAEQRRELRSQVLQVRVDDLQRVAACYLKPEQANVAVLSGPAAIAEAGELGLEVITL